VAIGEANPECGPLSNIYSFFGLPDPTDEGGSEEVDEPLPEVRKTAVQVLAARRGEMAGVESTEDGSTPACDSLCDSG